MDNGAIQSAYDAGVRAYKTHEGILFYLDTVANYRMSPAESPSFWHALRAYQDDQRKKGVPIVLNQYRDGITVHVDEKQNRTVTRFFTFTNGNSLIEQQFNGVYTSRFTNFRWREGYPKHGGMANVKVLGDGVVELLKNNQ